LIIRLWLLADLFCKVNFLGQAPWTGLVVIAAAVVVDVFCVVVMLHVGRWLGSDGSDSGEADSANVNTVDTAAGVDHLPTMWLGAQSGR